jgi:predicted porin
MGYPVRKDTSNSAQFDGCSIATRFRQWLDSTFARCLERGHGDRYGERIPTVRLASFIAPHVHAGWRVHAMNYLNNNGDECMKKSLLSMAAFAALAAPAAFAQSSVTVYGKVDLGLVLDSGNPAGKSVRLSSGVSGGSRLGFKGIEDLGGGYKAGFQLETGYCADSAAGAPNFCTGSNNFMGRVARGDLIGSFGALSAGRQYSLGYSALVSLDPFGTGLAAQTDNTDGKGNYIVDPSAIRLNNAVAYTTPSLAGLTGSAEISLGEQTGGWRKGTEFGAAVNYASGPAFGSLTLYHLDNVNGSGTARQTLQLGGTYDFGVVKLHALAQKVIGDPTGAARVDVLSLMGGVTVPLAGGNVLASFINRDDRTAANQDAKQWGLGYLYPLSKLTSVYMAFAHIDNTHGGAFHTGNATETGVGDQSFNLGVVKNF